MTTETSLLSTVSIKSSEISFKSTVTPNVSDYSTNSISHQTTHHITPLSPSSETAKPVYYIGPILNGSDFVSLSDLSFFTSSWAIMVYCIAFLLGLILFLIHTCYRASDSTHMRGSVGQFPVRSTYSAPAVMGLARSFSSEG